MRPLMSSGLPAPSTMVVLSLSMMTRLALPRSDEHGVFQLEAGFFADHAAAGEDGDVFEHGLAAVAEARSLDGADLERAAQLVDDEGGQGFAFDVFGDDQHGAAGLGDLLEDRAAGPSWR